MTPYAFGLCLGFAGLAVMALGGLVARGHARDDDASNVALPTHGHAHGSAPGQPGHAGAHHAATSLQVAARAPRVAAARSLSPARRLLAWLSPRVVFSVLVGFGATGMLLRGRLAEPVAFILATLCGLLFEAAIVGPFSRFILGFGSAPARTLDHALFDEARAVSDFDKNGQGLIAIDVDGQVVQLLGTLRRGDRDATARVRTGDRLVVEEVDAERNRCTVSRRGADTEEE